MSDITRVCALCYFYNETSMDCERFPPSVQTTYVDKNGDKCAHWDQPFIENPWHTRCGEWKEDFDSLEGDSAESKAAYARLEIIVAQHKKTEQESQENVNRDSN
jgi:hypothetical protein